MVLSPPPAREQEEGMKEDGGAASAQPEPVCVVAKKRPFSGRKVLKRTRRLIQEDGTETVRIEYIVDEKRIEQLNDTQQNLQVGAEELGRKRKREYFSSPFGKGKKHKAAQITDEQSKDDEQEEKQKQQSEEEGDDAICCAACGQVGHKRFELECPLYIGDEAQSSSSGQEDSDFEDDAISHRLKIKRQSK